MIKKILYLITELDVGGAEKTLWRIVRALDRRDYDPTVACLFGRGEVAGWIEAEGIPVVYLDVRSKLDARAFLRVVQLLKRGRFDILHTFLFHANLVGRLASIFALRTRVFSSVRVAERRRPFHLFLDWLTQGLIEKEICVSRSVASFTREHARISADRLAVIPNGVALEEYRAASCGVYHEKLGLSDGDRLVCCVGRLDEQKSVDDLVRAFASVVGAHNAVHLAVAGIGPDRARLETLADELTIAQAVHFLGFVHDVPELLADSDVFVLPSRWEGMPNVLLEAAASGTPIVATDVEGVREIIEDGRSGLIVSPGDVAGLGEAMLRVLDDSALAADLAERARQRVAEDYDIDALVNRYLELYQGSQRQIAADCERRQS